MLSVNNILDNNYIINIIIFNKDFNNRELLDNKTKIIDKDIWIIVINIINKTLIYFIPNKKLILLYRKLAF